ncbi:hypothetical protein LWC34_51130 [Kibdelosporangium philippinense]|uniref:Uncharacterized protein n=1 Tax=Kibdelosporangium philippinense TaxID=211113 RepID=A0ABS8ZTS3_9PSEU|nr:hypothetical protein [Kibdelosporangium philippinense]MCE7011106.1 hypothetical protein [Kibdelosporangium philippinense]
MKMRILGACLTVGATVGAVFAPAAQAVPQFDQAMVQAAATELGVSTAKAASASTLSSAFPATWPLCRPVESLRTVRSSTTRARSL